MAGEIKQVIGFDTSGAIQAVDALDSRLNVFGTTLDSVAGKLNSFGAAANKAFNFDASKGVSSLNKVSDSASATQQKVSNAFGSIANQSQKAGAAIQQGLGSKAVSNLEKTGEAAQKAGSKAAKGTKELVVSFKTLIRIISTQVIIRAFSQISQAITQSIRDNIDFARSIREIGTILPTAQRNAEGLSQAVRGISDAFNLPVAQVSEGLYQAVSNQIGNAAESIKFLGTASAFARVSVAALDDSVNLLTAVINAFQLDATDADVVAAQLFKTIELGRTRASEMANSLGRILPVMRELGVTTSETFAAISTLTIQGQKTSEALTQIRGAANALLKPTKETSQIIHDLGFNSAQALVAARGLGGAFQALRGATDGSLEAFAKIVPRVRGMNAALALAGSGAEKFESDLLKIEQAAQDVLDQELQFIMDTNAEEVSSAMNQLANVFTVDVGAALNETLGNVLKLTGGITTLTTVFKVLVPVFAIAATALALYATYAAGAIVQTKLLALAATAAGGSIAASFVLATAGVAAVVGAILLAKSVLDAYTARYAKALAEIEKQHGAEIKALEQKAAAQRQLDDARLRRLNAQTQEEIAVFNRKFNEEIKLAKKANDQIIADQERVVKNVISASEKILQATVNRFKKQQKLRDTALSNVKDLEADLSDLQFENDNKRLKGLQRYSNLEDRATELAIKGRSLLGAATTEADAASARAVIDRAAGYASEASALAEQLGHRQAIQDAEELSESILQGRIDAERTLAKWSEHRADLLAKEIKTQRERLTTLKEAAQAVEDAPSLFEGDQPLQGKALEDATRARGEALKAFRQAVLDTEGVSASDLIEVSKLALDVEKELSQAQIEGLTVESGAIAELQDTIQEQFSDFRVQFGAEIISLEAAQDITIEDPNALSAAANRIVAEDRKLAEQADAINIKRREQVQLLQQAQTAQSAIGDAADNTAANLLRASTAANLLGGTFADLGPDQQFVVLLEQAANASQEVLNNLSRGQDATGSIKELQRLSTRLQSLREFTQGGTGQAPFGFQTSVEQLITVQDKIEAILAGQQAISDLQEATGATTAAGNLNTQLQRQQDYRTILEQKHGAAADKAKAEAQAQAEVTDQASNTANAVGGINQQLAITVQATQQIYDNLLKASQVSFSTPSTSPITAATGGLAHFAKGGGPRGTDTIPAWLSPGEYVMNARSTRRFYSQLQSMNSGTQPVYRQEGGPVTNVGDINVHVASGQKGDAAGRTIARSIRRELRRNTSQL
jgi:TP901 family phage tail tape measure protein